MHKVSRSVLDPVEIGVRVVFMEFPLDRGGMCVAGGGFPEAHFALLYVNVDAVDAPSVFFVVFYYIPYHQKDRAFQSIRSPETQDLLKGHKLDLPEDRAIPAL